jgi:K+-sensing histidine kinase KdpD
VAMEQTDIKVRYNDKILLVDDDIAFLKVSSSILQTKGFSVGVAKDASQAIEEIKNHYYNLVILDMLLPDMTGLDLLTCINRVQPDIISVILTGYSSVESSVQSLNQGVFAYLEKPINPDRLLEVIRRGLEKYHLINENRRLLRELEQRNRDLNILLTVSQAVSSSIDFEQIVNSAMNIMSKTLAVDGCFIQISENHPAPIEGRFGFDNTIYAVLKQADFRNGNLKDVFQKNEPVIINQIKNCGDLLIGTLQQNGYRSMLAIPVSPSNNPEGIMLVATLTKHIFTPLEVNLFKAIARETAYAIKNVQLFEEASKAKALRELDSLRTELLANVSHELRTPLAAIKGFASSLLQPDISFDDETRTSFIQTIDSEADRLSHLIDDLLLMSRIEAGSYKAKKEWFEIGEIISSIRDRLYNIAVKHNLRISIPDNLPPVLVDGSRIGEVITNLVENSVKYSPEGTDILLKVEQQADRLVIHVQDNGIGIPEEAWSKVFERFYRHNNNAKRKGFGLGLCICRGIVESHSGQIWVKSQPGQGSCFSFSLPIDQDPQPL